MSTIHIQKVHIYLLNSKDYKGLGTFPEQKIKNGSRDDVRKILFEKLQAGASPPIQQKFAFPVCIASAPPRVVGGVAEQGCEQRPIHRCTRLKVGGKWMIFLSLCEILEITPVNNLKLHHHIIDHH